MHTGLAETVKPGLDGQDNSAQFFHAETILHCVFPAAALQERLTMAQPVEHFICKTGVVAGTCNIVLNSLFSWAGNTAMADVPPGALVVDTVITCIIMSLLMTLFISADTRRALKAGTIEPVGQYPLSWRLLRRLPVRPWKLGLVIGFAVAALVTPCILGLFFLFNMTSLAFFAFVSIKAVYSMLFGYLVARWVILRHLAAAV